MLLTLEIKKNKSSPPESADRAEDEVKKQGIEFPEFPIRDGHLL